MADISSIYARVPNWPEVRCDECHRVYTLPPDNRRDPISGNCPACGCVTFQTAILNSIDPYGP